MTQSDVDGWRAFSGLAGDDMKLEQAVEAVLVERVLSGGETDSAPDPGTDVAVRRLAFRAYDVELKRRLRAEAEDTVTDAEIEERTPGLMAGFELPPRVRLRNLYKQFPSNASEAQKAEVRAAIDGLLRRVRSGEDFGEVAEAESESGNRYRGGKVGWVRPGELAPAVERVAFGLSEGEVSEPIETTDGVTLLLCEETAEARTADDERIESEVRRRIATERSEERWAQLRADLLADVELNLEEARRVSAPDDLAVATMKDGETVTLRDVRRAYRLQRGKATPADLPPQRFRELVEMVALWWRLPQLAQELGIELPPAKSRAIAHAPKAFRANEALAARIQQRFTPPTEEELRAIYERQERRFVQQESFLLQVFRKRLQRAALRDGLDELRTLEQRLSRSEISFEELTRMSDHPSAQSGGRLPWLDKQQVAALGPIVARQAVRLQPGQTTGLVEESHFGQPFRDYWIVRSLDRRARRPLTFEEAQEDLQDAYGRGELKRLRQEIVDEIRSSLDYELREAT